MKTNQKSISKIIITVLTAFPDADANRKPFILFFQKY